MWIIDDKVKDRILSYPKSALRVADDLGEMLLYTGIEVDIPDPSVWQAPVSMHFPLGAAVRALPKDITLSLVGVGVPYVTGNEMEDVMSYFSGDRHLFGILTLGKTLFLNTAYAEFGMVKLGYKHPITKQPVWYVENMKLLCRQYKTIN